MRMTSSISMNRVFLMSIFITVAGLSEISGQTIYPTPRQPVPPPSSHFIRVDWRQGNDITDSRYGWVRDLHRETGFRAIDIRAGIQTSEERTWARALNYPAFGIGYARYWFDQKALQDMIGSPNALYLFGMFPLVSAGSLRLNLDMAGGLSFNFRPYDPDENPYNDAIGSPVLGYFDLGLSGALHLPGKVEFVAGLNIIHNSNGRIRTPNMGLDLLGMKFGLIVHSWNSRERYGYFQGGPASAAPTRSHEKHVLLPVKGAFWNLSLAGVVNSTDRRDDDETVYDMRGPQYFALSLAAEWQRKYSGIGAYGIGLNVMYDASLGEAYPGEGAGAADLTIAGLTIGHELFVHRLGVLTQVGFSPWNAGVKKEARGIWYLRAGMRIHITPNWWALIALKTMDGAVADFVEWGVGYSIIRDQKR